MLHILSKNNSFITYNFKYNTRIFYSKFNKYNLNNYRFLNSLFIFYVCLLLRKYHIFIGFYFISRFYNTNTVIDYIVQVSTV